MNDLLLRYVPYFLFFAGLYFLLGRKWRRGEGAGFLLAVVAALPLWDGGLVLVREYGRLDDGRVVAGVVVERLSSTGADGTRTIGGSRFSRPGPRRRLPYFVTSEGFRFHDVLARVILTGSKNAWVIQYRVPCAAGTCWRIEGVPYALWSDLSAGRMVNIRTAKGLRDPGRLDQNPQWSTGLAKLGIGSGIGLLAALVSGRLNVRKRELVTVPAIVTSVNPVTTATSKHWRVEFAYLCSDGTACEGATIVYAPKLQPGDQCTAVYSPDAPHLGMLQVT